MPQGAAHRDAAYELFLLEFFLFCYLIGILKQNYILFVHDAKFQTKYQRTKRINITYIEICNYYVFA